MPKPIKPSVTLGGKPSYMTLENNLQNYEEESYKKIIDRYGSDESKWGYLVGGTYRCRAGRGQGFGASELKADLELGKKICPISGEFCGEQVVPHPADNVAGVIFAKKFPDKCPVCGLAPTSIDFDIE